MDLLEYQVWTKTVAVYPDAELQNTREINYLIAGLNEEAGEVSGVWKKLIRKGDVTLDKDECIYDFDRIKLVEEMGDVLWYLARLAQTINVPLETIAEVNRAKLMQRKAENTLKEHK